MKTLTIHVLVVLFGLATIACQKKPDVPAPQPAPIGIPGQPTPPPPPPPVTNCQGATIMYTMPVDTIPASSSPVIKSYVIPNFEVSCGDSLRVFIQNTNLPLGSSWTEIFTTPGGNAYYSLLNQTVTLHYATGEEIYVEILAVLK